MSLETTSFFYSAQWVKNKSMEQKQINIRATLNKIPLKRNQISGKKSIFLYRKIRTNSYLILLLIVTKTQTTQFFLNHSDIIIANKQQGT